MSSNFPVCVQVPNQGCHGETEAAAQGGLAQFTQCLCETGNGRDWHTDT